MRYLLLVTNFRSRDSGFFEMVLENPEDEKTQRGQSEARIK